MCVGCAATSSKAVKCPLDQRPSWLCLNAMASPQQPEATFKVFSAKLIKWAEVSSDLEHNLTICSTICSPQSNDYWCPPHTFFFFRAVRPVGWGTRLKLRGRLLGFHVLIVLRCLGWALNAKGGDQTSVWLTAWLSNLYCGHICSTRLTGYSHYILRFFDCLGKLVHCMFCFQPLDHSINLTPAGLSSFEFPHMPRPICRCAWGSKTR